MKSISTIKISPSNIAAGSIRFEIRFEKKSIWILTRGAITMWKDSLLRQHMSEKMGKYSNRDTPCNIDDELIL